MCSIPDYMTKMFPVLISLLKMFFYEFTSDLWKSLFGKTIIDPDV